MAGASTSDSAAVFQGCVDKLVAVLGSLKRFESTFSPEAKKVYEASLAAVEGAGALCRAATTPQRTSLVGYLQGSNVDGLRAAQAQLQQCVVAIVGGAVPVPRSSKEDLTNMRTELQGLKFADVPNPQLAQLRSLYHNATDGRGDVDLVEAKLDDVVRQLTASVYSGAIMLEKQDLDHELGLLKARIEEVRSIGQQGSEEDAALLSLVVNSLERLHGVCAVDDDSEDDAAEAEGELEDEDDDDDDPFFMPLPSALKLADASKFSELAKPIKEADSPFMIAMDDDTPSTQDMEAATPFRTSALEEQSPVLTDQDFVPVEPEAHNTAGARQAAAELAALSIPSPKDISTAASPLKSFERDLPAAASETEAAGSAAEAGTAPAGEEGAVGPAARAVPEPGVASSAVPAAQEAPAAAGPAAGGELVTATAASPQPSDDKLNQFVNFLHGDNPGACQFHAQMRLSHEGCRKLANFIKNSSRVRALSLSHNLIGDAGLKILCEGLVYNRSVTALDLPDNDISDEGIKQLTISLAHNTSLTQLQLAYNKIGNDGAAALARLVKDSQSLKKLGLSHNSIGKAGCQALTSAISSNQSLNHLQLLPGNPVEEKDAKALAKALKRNKKFSIRALLGVD